MVLKRERDDEQVNLLCYIGTWKYYAVEFKNSCNEYFSNLGFGIPRFNNSKAGYCYPADK